MNEESKTQHCGDSCGAVAAMAVAFREYVPPEQRMATAIKQVLSGEMSQRGAAEANGVAQRTLSDRIKAVSGSAHPTKTQASTEVSPSTHSRPGLKVDLLKELRALAKQLGITRVGDGPPGKAGQGQIYAALIEAGHDVPDHLTPPSIKTKRIPNEPPEQELPVNDPLPVLTNGGAETDLDDDPIYDEQLDIDAVRDHVCAEVQLSSRPNDFKRAIALLRELDAICTDAWYRRHPEPWNHHDWAHVNSEIKAIYSLVGQRAEETADELLHVGPVVTVGSAPVA